MEPSEPPLRFIESDFSVPAVPSGSCPGNGPTVQSVQSSQLLQSPSPSPQESAPRLSSEYTPPSPPRLPYIPLPLMNEDVRRDEGDIGHSTVSEALELAWQHHDKRLEHRSSESETRGSQSTHVPSAQPASIAYETTESAHLTISKLPEVPSSSARTYGNALQLDLGIASSSYSSDPSQE